MKVLLVDQFGKTTGRDTLALAERLNVAKDIDMTVYLSEATEIPCNKYYSSNIAKGFHGVYKGNFLNKVINYLKGLKQLKQYICDNNIDIVHLQWFSLPWIEWIYISQIKKIAKVVITVHDIIPFDNRPFEMESLNKIYDRADYLFIHTPTAYKLFHENYATKTPVKIITQGFCCKADYKRISNAEAKHHFGIPENSVVFLYYGTIRPSKGLDTLIKAVGNARLENKMIVLLAAGAPHRINEGTYKLLVDENLKSQAQFIKFGFVPQEEEQWYFSAADVLCLPYRELTQSGVAQLGLMYELPIIASDVGEIKEAVREGYNGCLCKVDDSDSLKNAIIRLAGSKEMRAEYSANSAYLGENEFSIDKKALCIETVYRGLFI